MFNVFAMDEFDRELAVAEKAYEIEMVEASFMESMIDTKMKINLAKSEYKIMTEGCKETANGDLLYLFNEAAKEAEGAKEGVLTKVKNALVNFFTSFWNSIQKIFTGKNTEAYNKLKASNEPVTLPFSQKVVDAADKVVTKCEEAVKNPSLKILGPVAAILGVTAAGAEAKTMFDEYKKNGQTPWQTTKAQACGVWDKLCSLVERIKNLLPKTNENSENAKETFNVIGGIKEFLTGLINKVKAALGIGDVEDSDEAKDQNDDGGKTSVPTPPSNAGTKKTKGPKISAPHTGPKGNIIQNAKQKIAEKKDEKQFGKGSFKTRSFSGLGDDDQAMFGESAEE